eukprot:TRINITY_DN479_c0_g2_i2.p2 TRINITY_DN479_c0_g2~~TRINITY_DN479_c0_g2_i2.p2  ORF type:complete len:497 (+),score=198.81 TRINITY_DN479_c0_g2_i2:88-1491(+)
MSHSRCPYFPETPSPEVKVRSAFDELRGLCGAVGTASWRDAFQRLNMPFSSATCEDLFQKADSNADGSVTFSEFQAFAEAYPTMLDCIYYRAKDFWAERTQREGIDAARRKLEDIREQELRARDGHRRSQEETDNVERALRAAEQELQDAEDQETQAQQTLVSAKGDVENQKQLLADSAGQVHQGREGERQLQAAMQEAQRNRDRLARAAEQQQLAVQKADERLKELEQMLQLQRQECERQRGALDRAATAVTETDCNIRDLESRGAEAREQVAMLMDQHRQQEAVLADLNGREAAAAQGARQAQQVYAQQRLRAGQASAVFEQAKQAEQAKLKAAEELGQSAAEQIGVVQSQEDDNAGFRERRRAIDEDERMMLEQEVRLREERDCLQRKEDKLRSDFTTFTRGSAQEPPSPPPYQGSTQRAYGGAPTAGAPQYNIPPMPQPYTAGRGPSPTYVSPGSRSHYNTTA